MRLQQISRVASALPFAAVLVLAGCGGGGSDSGSGGTGSLTLDITDAPVDQATAVDVVFTGITLKPQSGAPIEFHCDDPGFDCNGEGSRSINLLDLTGDVSERLLDDVEVPAGRYDWLRLHVAAADPNPATSTGESEIRFHDIAYPLVVPSGSQTGLKLVRGFSVPLNGEASFTIDFDLRKAVTKTGDGRYFLRPALRLVDNRNAGHLVGEIALSFVQTECPTGDASGGLAVYLFEGFDAETGSMGSDHEPVTTAMAELIDASGDYEYRIGFLAPGPYTAAVTCEASRDDDPDEAVEDLEFVATANVEVAEGPQATVLNFE